MPITLARTYRPRDTVSRPFGIGATHSYQIYLVGNGAPYDGTQLVLPDGGRIRYDRISPGTGVVDAVLEHTATQSQFYKSRLTWNQDYGFVVCFVSKEDAMKLKAELTERLKKFGLEVEPTKTKVLEFGRDAERHARTRGVKPETFDFQGFTHYCSRTKDGRRFRMKRVTSRKKFWAKLVAMK
jgi:hypothetical protein